MRGAGGISDSDELRPGPAFGRMLRPLPLGWVDGRSRFDMTSPSSAGVTLVTGAQPEQRAHSRSAPTSMLTQNPTQASGRVPNRAGALQKPTLEPVSELWESGASGN